MEACAGAHCVELVMGWEAPHSRAWAVKETRVEERRRVAYGPADEATFSHRDWATCCMWPHLSVEWDVWLILSASFCVLMVLWPNLFYFQSENKIKHELNYNKLK